MKKLIALLAFVLVSTAAWALGDNATNDFSVATTCPPQTLSNVDFGACTPVTFVNPGSTSVTTASWTINKWGSTGGFSTILTGGSLPAGVTYAPAITIAGTTADGAYADASYQMFSTACNTSATVTIAAATLSTTAAVPNSTITVTYNLAVVFN